MRRYAKLIGTAAAVGVVAFGSSAYTASNDMTAVTAPMKVAGYGEVTITGAVITEVAVHTLATDSSELDHVLFTSSTNLTGRTTSMTLKQGGAVVGVPYSCAVDTPWGAGVIVIKCDASVIHPLINTFDTIGFTVQQ